MGEREGEERIRVPPGICRADGMWPPHDVQASVQCSSTSQHAFPPHPPTHTDTHPPHPTSQCMAHQHVQRGPRCGKLVCKALDGLEGGDVANSQVHLPVACAMHSKLVQRLFK